MLGQGHDALYWNRNCLHKFPYVLQRKLLTHTLSDFDVLCEAVGVVPAMVKVKWK